MQPIQRHLFQAILFATIVLPSCGPSIKTTVSWANKEKMPAQPIKTIFIMALTDNMEVKLTLEKDLVAAAESRGYTAIKSIDAIGPVGIKNLAPHKEAFEKKMADLHCDAIFTVALVNQISDTCLLEVNIIIL